MEVSNDGIQPRSRTSPGKSRHCQLTGNDDANRQEEKQRPRRENRRRYSNGMRSKNCREDNQLRKRTKGSLGVKVRPEAKS